MPASLSALRTRVNYQRRDTTSDFVTNDEITAYFNEGLRRINGNYDWDFTATSASIAFVEGSPAYAISSVAPDFKNPIDLFYSDNYAFEWISPEDFDVLSASKYNIYTKEGNFLKIGTSFGSGSLSLRYYSTYMAQTSGGSWQAELVNDSDMTLLPDLYEDVVVDYALMQIAKKEGKSDDYNVSRSNFQNGMTNLKRDYISRVRRFLKRWLHVNELGAGRRLPWSKKNPLNN